MRIGCQDLWLDDAPAGPAVLEVADGLITAVHLLQPGEGAGEWSVGVDLALPGLVLPGFADAHSHVFHRGLRGRTHAPDPRGSFWTWREAMYALAGRLDPDGLHALAVAAYTELLSAGHTAVGEFHYLHHPPGGSRRVGDAPMEQALIAAADEVGIRLTLLDTLYLTAGLDPAAVLSPVQHRFSDGSVDAWAERVAALPAAVPPDGARPGHRTGVAVHSVRAVPPAALAQVAAVLPELVPDRLLHVHLSEQPQENADCLAATGLTPTALLDEAGLLGPATAVVHATHLSGDDVARLGRARVTAVVCPTTEADLADGLPALAPLLAAGVGLATGGDQHVVVDPFAQARGLEWGERLATGRRGTLAPAELVAAATRASHAAIGSTAGRVVVGAPADLVAVRTDSARTAGSLPEQLVLAASAADVSHVVVGGRLVARDGSHHRLGDPGPLLQRALRPLLA